MHTMKQGRQFSHLILYQLIFLCLYLHFTDLPTLTLPYRSLPSAPYFCIIQVSPTSLLSTPQPALYFYKNQSPSPPLPSPPLLAPSPPSSLTPVLQPLQPPQAAAANPLPTLEQPVSVHSAWSHTLATRNIVVGQETALIFLISHVEACPSAVSHLPPPCAVCTVLF